MDEGIVSLTSQSATVAPKVHYKTMFFFFPVDLKKSDIIPKSVLSATALDSFLEGVIEEVS